MGRRTDIIIANAALNYVAPPKSEERKGRKEGRKYHYSV